MRRLVPLLLVPFLLLPACDLVAPCDLSAESNEENALDRRWSLVTVNGNPIPANGVAIPGSSDRLLGGNLHFQTTWASGGCLNVRDKGRVVAVYRIVNAQGVAKTSTYAGSFTYQHSDGVVTLSAKKSAITGTRTVNDLGFSATIPLFGSYTLVFRKVS